MRRCIGTLAAALAGLVILTAAEVSAAPLGAHGVRGHSGHRALGARGFHHGRQGVYVGHGLRRLGHGGTFHHRRFGHHGFGYGRHAYLGGFGGGYGYGSGDVIQQNIVETGPAPDPTVLGLPTVLGIRSAPAGDPVVYVIHGRGDRPALVRKAHRPGAKVLSVKAEAEHGGGAASEPDGRSGGPRIVHLTVPRGR